MHDIKERQVDGSFREITVSAFQQITTLQQMKRLNLMVKVYQPGHRKLLKQNTFCNSNKIILVTKIRE
jgi:hypothetical protein